MKRIGIYPRKSVYRDNSDSVQVQIQLCKEYSNIIFKDEDIEFLIYDRDEGFSGKNTNRPSYQELMIDVKNNLLDVVIVYKLDRISRNVQEFASTYEIFQQHNVAFISVKESFDTTTPIGRTVMFILAAFAQLERENTSERVTDNMQALGAAGKWTGGRLPSGMTSVRMLNSEKEHSFLVVDKNTIGLVNLLFELILQGYPITRIERHCRDNGIRSQTGKFLNTSQIYNIITNPVYCQNSLDAYHYFNDLGCKLPDPYLFDGSKGLIGYGRTQTTVNTQRKCNKNSWIIAIGIHEPVIAASDWIATQKRLGINKMCRTSKHEVGILKGVLRCSCGARMDIRTYAKNNIIFSYYYCSDMARQGKAKCNSGFIRTDQVEDAFLNKLRKIRFNPEGFKLKETDKGNLLNSSTIKSDIKSLQSSINNLTTALMQSMESTASIYIVKQIEELDKQKKILESNLRKSELNELNQNSLLETEKYIYDSICYLLDNFDSISYTGKNEFIRKIVKTCILEDKNLRIIF